jgi:RNA polymerase sigma-70 factor, ECF subfamily
MTTGFTEADLLACVPNLRRYAKQLRRHHHNAEDLLQDVLTRAWAKRHMFTNEGDGSLMRWLSFMMHNVGASQTIRWGRENQVLAPWPDSSVGKPWDGGASPASADCRVVVSDLAYALAHLNPEQQEAIRLVGLDGMTYEEAAAIAGVPVGTIRSRISRGREQAREWFKG